MGYRLDSIILVMDTCKQDKEALGFTKGRKFIDQFRNS